MAGAGGGAGSAPFCNSCLNGPIDLKFGMYIVLGKFLHIEKKIRKKLPRSCISAFFEHSFNHNRAFTRNAIKSVADVIFQFCFHL